MEKIGKNSGSGSRREPVGSYVENSEEKRTISQFILVERQEQGQRLDALLSARFRHVSRADWKERIRSGSVLVQGRSVRGSRRLKEGERIDFSFERRPEPEINRDYRTVHEDDDVLVIDKPPDLPVHPSGVYNQNTLHALLKNDRGPDFISYFAHRLDRETSGLLVLGKNRRAAAFLNRAFRGDQVRKEYLVLVEGAFPLRLDAPGWIGPNAGGPVRKKMRFAPAGEGRLGPGRPGPEFRACRTDFRLLRALGEVSLVKARLYTGRLHQIRATLWSLGYPVVGDRLYGVDERLYLKFIADQENDQDRALLRLGRTALHCRRLILPHPRGGFLRLRSRVPEDMASFIRRCAGAV